MSTLDEYLVRLRRQLQASPEETEEILREVRSHLELAMQDTVSAGADEATRLARAVERFGAAEHVGRALRQVHGRATWEEAVLAALPLLLLGALVAIPQVPGWIAPLILGAATVLGWRRGWPLWWWAWLGWLPLAIPGAPEDLLWGAVAYIVILVLVSRRDWLEATLAVYPLPTAWAFHRVILTSVEVRSVGWSPAVLSGLGVGAAVVWAGLLVRTLRTPSGATRIARVLEGQIVILLLHILTIVAARLWPTYPVPYPFTLRYFLLVTLPYALFKGMPLLLFFVLTSLPGILALAKARARSRPPSQPATGG
jgi:hypothetical protein